MPTGGLAINMHKFVLLITKNLLELCPSYKRRLWTW